MAEDLAHLLADLREEEVLSIVKRRLETEDPLAIVEELRNGMTMVGERFERSECFLSEMMMAAEIFKAAYDLVGGKLQTKREDIAGTVVIGTVEGDVHTLGKDIVSAVMQASGFRVVDLGVDVSPEKFIQNVKEVKPDILGMSTLLTMGMHPIKATAKALVKEGLRETVKVMIGGNPIFGNPEAWLKETGADDYGRDAVDAVKKARKLIGK
jgi:methanogenic corrinoid protein MtbC1